jgi:enoyl-[acyl-carrier protein] reductase II
MKNRVAQLLKVKYPLIQAGMVWCSGWKLASAVSNAGGLGTIGSGSMYPDVLKEHLEKMRKATNQLFAVNLPLIYPQVEEHIQLIEEFQVPVVITSAGNPMKYAKRIKDAGCILIHVVANQKFALKAVDAGCDAIIAEGFEAGGHNGKDEITTMCLIPDVLKVIDIPVIAAGGIATGKSMAAAFALGAEGVQIGSRFAVTAESSAHINYKNAVVQAKGGDTSLTLKELTPVRLLKNQFYEKVQKAYANDASVENLRTLLGKGRAKKGIFEGDLEEGELEIGQVAGQFTTIQPAVEVVEEIIKGFNLTVESLSKNRF